MLLDDIKMGESATLEFKRQLNRESERWLKTVVAFANCKGGRIIFGVSNAREIIGLDGDLHAQRDAIVDAIANACEPNPPTEISAEEIDGKTVIVLSVAQGRESPYYIRAEGEDDGTYVRYDASTRKADRAIIQELNLSAHFKGVKRVDTFEIPPDAIRELIVNAILHRSYVEADASPVSVALYDNRLEITSPGSLPRGMTVERMLNGDSICRNKVLAEALAYMNLIEDWGSGILRVKGDLAEAKLPPVEVIDFGSSVRVVIKRAVHDASQINTDKPQINSGISSGGDGTISKIVMAIRGNQSITVGEIAKICGKTLNVTRGIMTKMRECNLIQREGARKNGRWVVPKWVDDKVLESEERELCPVRLGPTGEVEYMISVDFTDDPILYAKLKKLSRQAGKSIEELMQDLIKKAVADFTRKPLL